MSHLSGRSNRVKSKAKCRHQGLRGRHPPQRELRILTALSAASNDASQQHVLQLLDHFLVDGPNGTHGCLVLEMLEPSISDLVQYCADNRVPARFAKQAILHFLQALDFLARADVGHGGRLLPCVPGSLAEEYDFLETDPIRPPYQEPGRPSTGHSVDGGRCLASSPWKPETAPVSRLDGKPLDGNVPSYLVWPAPFRAKELLRASPAVKIIDFGEAFFTDDAPKTLHTPLTVRAPEVLFGDTLD